MQDIQAQLKVLLGQHGGRLPLSSVPLAWQTYHGNTLPPHFIDRPALLATSFSNICKVQHFTAADGTPADLLQANYNESALARVFWQIRQELHNAKQHVSCADVLSKLCERLGVTKFEDMGLGLPMVVGFVKEMVALEGRVDLHVSCYLASR
jgi:hypothetical protein